MLNKRIENKDLLTVMTNALAWSAPSAWARLYTGRGRPCFCIRSCRHPARPPHSVANWQRVRPLNSKGARKNSSRRKNVHNLADFPNKGQNFKKYFSFPCPLNNIAKLEFQTVKLISIKWFTRGLQFVEGFKFMAATEFSSRTISISSLQFGWPKTAFQILLYGTVQYSSTLSRYHIWMSYFKGKHKRNSRI